MLKELVQDIEITGRYLRKNDGLRYEDIHPVRRIKEMNNMGWSKRDVYEAGQQDGEATKPMNLTPYNNNPTKPK